MADSTGSPDLERAPGLPSKLEREREGGFSTGQQLLQLDQRAKPEEPPGPPFVKKFWRWLIASNLEERGIRRVQPDERRDWKSLGYLQVILFWFSVNLATNNVTLGMLGPAVYELSFLDAALCGVFGVVAGNLPVAFISTYGPLSGNRTLVFARYTMGWWPTKVIVILNLVVLLGYCLIDAVVAGQILSAVSTNGSMSVVVGIIIVAVISWVISTFGVSLVHYYERYAWVAILIVYGVLAGTAGPHFDLSAQTQGDAETQAGDRLSFFGICLAAAITYSGSAADYFVYYPEDTRRPLVFFSTFIGLCLSFTIAIVIGVGLGSGISNNQSWSDAYNSGGQGALFVEGFQPLNGFGKFCAVVAALGLIGNIVPSVYSSGIEFQILGHYFTRIPRVFWNTLGVIIFTVCALAGREHLAEIFTNLLAIMGYWVCIWIGITLCEVFIFRRRRGFDWDDWNDPSKLPIGLAAFFAFLVGWAGVILSMGQTWYIGPIARLVGQNGADMGNYVGFSWGAIVYIPSRWLELRFLKR